MKLHKHAFLAVLSLITQSCSLLPEPEPAITTIKIVAFNDFHGQLQPLGDFNQSPSSSSSGAGQLGGVGWLAAYIKNLKRQNPDTLVVSAGDLIGATPLISALFHDESTIESMNRLGLDLSAVGNHEFDEGTQELKRMQLGGCHPSDPRSCRGADVGTPLPFEGARFQYLAANIVEAESGKTLFPTHAIKMLGEIPVGFIGITLKETPTEASPNGVAGLRFLDEAATVNALIPTLKRQGVETIVILIHQGGTVPTPPNAESINRCDGGLEGSPIKDIVGRLDDAVDLVISGHTHQAYNCRIANRNGRLIPVTSAHASGRMLTDIDIRINPTSHEAIGLTANNIVVGHDDSNLIPDPTLESLVGHYEAITRTVANRVIGSIGASLSNTPNAAGESALGDFIADARLAATQSFSDGKAVVAFTNPGDIRSDLSYASSSAGEGDGKVTYAEAFSAQPFGNRLVTLGLTGAQIHTLLEQQFTGCTEGYPADVPPMGQPVNRILQVSNGFSYQWQEKGTPCDNVDPASITLNGVPIEPSRYYRINVNSFMAAGGDQFYVLKQGHNPIDGPMDLEALENYFSANPVVHPGAQDRIRVLP